MRVDEAPVPPIWPPVSSTAIALTVKSRRTRSSSIVSPKATTGLRLTRSYASARNVVISTVVPCRRAPTVPNAIPVSHTASAQPSSRASTAGGWASVVKSRSVCSRFEQGVADAAADEVEPVSGRGEPGRELVGDRVDRHEVHRRILLRTYELGGDGGERHGAPV